MAGDGVTVPALFLHKSLAADRALPRLRRDATLRVLAPIYEAVRARRLVFYQTTDREKPIPFAQLSGQRLPVLVVLTDTADGPNGPGRWADAEGVGEWAASGYAYVEPQTAEFFQIVAEETAIHRRFVLIETSGEMVNAWRRLFGGRPVKLRSVEALGAKRCPRRPSP